MINHELLFLVEKVLGKGRRTSGDNYAFFSPFVSHYKPKLEIDLSVGKRRGNPWHCWISDVQGGNIYSLFKKIGVSKNFYVSLTDILNRAGIKGSFAPSSSVIDDAIVSLPTEFSPLSSISSEKDIFVKAQMRMAIQYLRDRGLTSLDILRYNIGFCSKGEYSGMIIVPSYDSNVRLNFFVGRTIFEDSTMKFKNPKVTKNIVGFESMINWKLPITLTEGVFDAISARNNAIPMFGKTMSPMLKSKILYFRPPIVYIALDTDAFDFSVNILQYLIKNGVSATIVKLDGKDVNAIGFDSFTNRKLKSLPMDEYDIIKEKLTAK